MKSVSFALFAVLIISFAKAQSQDSLKKLAADTSVFTAVEMPPEFPGGNDAFLNFVGRNIRYPVDARGAQKQGKVIVQFIVEKDGRVSNVKVVRPLFPSLDAEAIRVVSSSPKWKTGKQNGYPLRVMYTIPITFNLSTHVYFDNH